MRMQGLEHLIRQTYPNVNIAKTKRLGKMRIRMSRPGAMSWQKFKNVDMVETDHAYFFDPREGLIKSYKRQLLIWSALLPLSVILVVNGLFPAVVVMVISALGVIACPINLAMSRKPKRIIMIWKNRIRTNDVVDGEHILQGALMKGDGFSIVADMKEVSDGGTIGYDADFIIRCTV